MDKHPTIVELKSIEQDLLSLLARIRNVIGEEEAANDSISSFMNELVVPDNESKTFASDLYREYVVYCISKKMKAESIKNVGASVCTKFQRKKTKHGVCFEGCKVLPTGGNAPEK